ncbi:MAG: hypothetical protein CM15mP49_31990 [Actinomycetota bacterium]|nr:MAG: hypothetical protein CM15mP49_31990 [Actinomycetota bacterium]
MEQSLKTKYRVHIKGAPLNTGPPFGVPRGGLGFFSRLIRRGFPTMFLSAAWDQSHASKKIVPGVVYPTGLRKSDHCLGGQWGFPFGGLRVFWETGQLSRYFVSLGQSPINRVGEFGKICEPRHLIDFRRYIPSAPTTMFPPTGNWDQLLSINLLWVLGSVRSLLVCRVIFSRVYFQSV